MVCTPQQVKKAHELFLAALCGYGAIKILESGESFLVKVMHSLGSGHRQSVRIEGFKLAQRVMVMV